MSERALAAQESCNRLGHATRAALRSRVEAERGRGASSSRRQVRHWLRAPDQVLRIATLPACERSADGGREHQPLRRARRRHRSLHTVGSRRAHSRRHKSLETALETRPFENPCLYSAARVATVLEPFPASKPPALSARLDDPAAALTSARGSSERRDFPSK